MSIPQPISTDTLDAPDHSLLHRQIAADTAAPVKSLIVDAAGKVGIGTETPAVKLDIVGAIAASGAINGLTLAPQAVGLQITGGTTPKTLTVPLDASVAGTNTGDQTISDATISTTDITTNDATTAKHGFLKKLPNDATKFLDGTGAFATPAGGMQYTDTRFKVGSFSRDMSVGSGTQAITGIGFAPKAVIFLGVKAGTVVASWGVNDGTNAAAFFKIANTANYSYTFSSIFASVTTGVDEYSGLITTLGADGYTITWTRTGTPTGDLQVLFLALR